MNSILVVYFSRAGNNYINGKIVDLLVGNTRIAAEKASTLADAPLFGIDLVTAYSNDYETCVKEAQLQLRQNARPPLVAYPENLDAFDTIVLCYPNYCGTMPMPVWTFLTHDDFAGKVILPLCTHEGSGLGGSVRDLKTLCPSADVRPGLALRGSGASGADAAISDWLAKQLHL